MVAMPSVLQHVFWFHYKTCDFNWWVLYLALSSQVRRPPSGGLALWRWRRTRDVGSCQECIQVSMKLLRCYQELNY